MDIEISTPVEDEYQIVRIHTIMNLKEKHPYKEIKELIISLHQWFDDIEYFRKEDIIKASHNIGLTVYPYKITPRISKDISERLVYDIKCFLDIADIEIIEDRFPINSIKYKLSK